MIAHRKVQVPGSAATIDLRAQDPNGVFGHPMLRLDAGRYPTGPGEVAVSAGVAAIFDLRLGDTWQQEGHDRRVVGLVENPLNLRDAFALVIPGGADPADRVSILVKASQQQVDARPRSTARTWRSAHAVSARQLPSRC